MHGSLRDLEVLAIDCQAGGATPAHGDLLELGWAICGADGLRGPVHQHWIVPRTRRRVSGPVRELTGWSEACLGDAVPEQEAWAQLHAESQRLAQATGPTPTVIHFARFELTFLRDLHARLGNDAAFPLDALCLHAIAARLFPALPRRNIRALAGYLGHSPQLMRRCGGHVEATAFIWSALLPMLEAADVHTWSDLGAWLSETPVGARPTRRVYPLAAEVRRALPDRPGVYRFLRRNSDPIYVGKATSLKKRVASHFKGGASPGERALELLTQVHDIHFTETASILEAALLETDEIKRLNPPYNVQLREQERGAWFASRDLHQTVQRCDEGHPIGPLPSQRALSSLAALNALAGGATPTRSLLAMVLAVPGAFLPDDALFAEGWQLFASEHLRSDAASAARRVDQAARALWLARRHAEATASAEDAPPDAWDLARVQRRLERALTQTGLLLRRARWLCLLSGADVAFRERDMQRARALFLSEARVIETHDLDHVDALDTIPPRAIPSRRARQAAFDVAAYDRLRVLATELARVHADQGEIAVRFGRHCYRGDRLARLLRWI